MQETVIFVINRDPAGGASPFILNKPHYHAVGNDPAAEFIHP
jgi:hypothetical protein